MANKSFVEGLLRRCAVFVIRALFFGLFILAPAIPGFAIMYEEPGALMGTIPRGSWLPALPVGTSLGATPERCVDLYQKFGDASRVTNKTSPLDYAPGATEPFTMRNWPPEHPPCVIPETKPAQPVSESVAQEACWRITGKNMRADCIFDVAVTGSLGFAQTYLDAQQQEKRRIKAMPRYRVTVTSKDREAMLDLVRKHKFQVFDHGSRYSDQHGYSVDAIAEPADIQKLEAAGYHVQRHEDVDELGGARQQEVGRGDRYRQPKSPPR